MIDYNRIPALRGVYLEDSYVLAISETPDQLAIQLEAVLTAEHPDYHDPRPGQQYCYADGVLIVEGDWGKVRIQSICQPRFELSRRRAGPE